MSFESFVKTKSSESRRSEFRPKKKQKLKGTNEVTITIGLKKLDGNELETIRGKCLPINAPKSATYHNIRERAIAKWSAFDRKFDGAKMDLFKLSKYKAEVGKDYKRIIFYLREESDHMISEKIEQGCQSETGVSPDSFFKEDPILENNTLWDELLSEQLQESCTDTSKDGQLQADIPITQIPIYQDTQESTKGDEYKNQVPFTSIGVDHALEQENRRMKVLGGVKGLTQNHDQLTQFCLIAPELARLSAEIECVSGMVQSSRKKHHEISPKLLLRQEDNIRKLRDTLSLSNPFTSESSDLHNIFAKSVMPEAVKDDVLSSDDRGREAYEEFVNMRIKGTVRIWDKMTKLKLKKCSSAAKVLKLPLKERTV
eukprot:gene8546-9457_t